MGQISLPVRIVHTKDLEYPETIRYLSRVTIDQRAGGILTFDPLERFYKILSEDIFVADGPDNGMIAGLLQNDPADGEAADVAYSGIALGICESTAITFGNVVVSNATAELQIVPNDEARSIGNALETSSAVGDIITVMVSLGWYGTT